MDYFVVIFLAVLCSCSAMFGRDIARWLDRKVNEHHTRMEEEDDDTNI